MILIDRGNEPPDLATIRTDELERVRTLIVQQGRPPNSKELAQRYRAVARPLWEAQHYKCCYCEHRERLKNNDVEHFRPKTKADRRPGSNETHGYWWLTWTWENLLFACRNCNRTGAKGIDFPLAQGSVVLQSEDPPTGEETPLLIDPATVDGFDHIQFVLDDHHQRWYPVAREGSLLGMTTIQTCNLDDPDLIDLYTDHVENNIRPIAREFDEAVGEDDEEAIAKCWKKALRLLRPRMVFSALSHDALAHFIPQSALDPYALVLPRPGS